MIKAFFIVAILIIIGIITTQKIPFRAKVKTAYINGQSIRYYIRGHGKPLLLLPGFAMTLEDWDPLLIEELSKKNKLIIMDYPKDPSSEEELAYDVIRLINKLKIYKVNLLGWSMGSFVAQVVAENNPDRVDKLILVSTALGGDDIVQGEASSIQNDLGGTWETAYVPIMFSPEQNNAMATYLHRRDAAIKTGEAPQKNSPDINQRAKLENVFTNKQQEKSRTDGLKVIKAPTLIIVGEKDTLLVPENARRVANRISGSRLEIVPNAGHAVLFQNLPSVVKIIDNFLN